MKKLFLTLLLLILIAGTSQAQLKVTFTLINKSISAGILSYDVAATVPAGQTWKVGSCNIRITVFANPTTALTPHPDNPVVGANPNISGSNGYQPMTTTTVNVSSGIGIGLNILTFSTSGFYSFAPGIYILGKVRYNVTTPFNADSSRFRNPPLTPVTVVYDSTRKMAYGGTTSDSARYTTANPPILEIGELTEIPKEFQLYQNYPNPFNPSTTIKYDIPKTTMVKIKVYDLTGKEVGALVNQEQEAGIYEINWNGTNFASGVYFYKIEAGDYTKVMRMVLIK